jgi:hypothetical protein
METVTHLVHAYKVAPWRSQRQWIGSFLLAVVVLAMIAALYLDVSAQAAIAGREIQDLTASIKASQQSSADLQTLLASMTSENLMKERALTLGFEPINPDEVEYLLVPGYVPPQSEILSSTSLPQLSAPSIPPEYKQSLLDWIDQNINMPWVRGDIP